MARIKARKIVLSYFYQRNFFLFSFLSDTVISDVLFANDIFQSDSEIYDKEKQTLLEQVAEIASSDVQGMLSYFIDYFFSNWKHEDIDLEYVFSVGKYFEEYCEEIMKKVDNYIDTFDYSKMSLVNKSLFALGYIEWKILGTPKEILINEMIELAKRYDEAGSPKLINAVMHKILSEGEKK